MTFAGAGATRWSLHARLDMRIPWTIPLLDLDTVLYAGNGALVTAMQAIRLVPANYRVHKKASRVAPARRCASPAGMIRGFARGLTKPASGRCRPHGSPRWTD